MKTAPVKTGIVGAGFAADLHASAIRMAAEEMVVTAVASRTEERARAFAEKHGIPQVFGGYREMLRDPDVELVTIAAPNYVHARVAIDCALAGKHVVCEKPLAMTLEEAGEMIGVCRRQGVLLLYAEELLFAPKYVKAKEMADQGAFGRIFQVKQSEKHFGPHSEWFWDVERAGGGALMDLGCHGIAFCRWFLNGAAIRSVYCQMGTQVHADRTLAEDNAVCILEFEGGAVGIVENSWSRRGGMDDSIEVHGDEGLTYADLLMGNALPTYSERGFGYAVEKAPGTQGWSWPVYEEIWNYGFPQEMRHFARCVRGRETPVCTGEDGLAVLEALYAGYESAGQGKKIALPFRAEGVKRPIDLWLRGRQAAGDR